MSKAVTVNTKPIEDKLDKVVNGNQDKIKKLMMQTSADLAKIAVKYTPPKKQGNWSTGIDKKDYYRYLFYIPLLMKDDQLVNVFNGKSADAKITSSIQKIRLILRQKLDEGYLYVIRKVANHKYKMWFFKTAGEAEAYQQIKYRGLMKLMWGIGFLEQGIKAPAFSKLLKSSPGLEKFKDQNQLTFNKQNLGKGAAGYSVNNVNKAHNPSLNNFVISQVNKKGKKTVDKCSEQVVKLALDELKK